MSKALFIPHGIYRTKSGEYLEYLSPAGRNSGEPIGLRFVDLGAKAQKPTNAMRNDSTVRIIPLPELEETFSL